jgi:hypothetical protein
MRRRTQQHHLHPPLRRATPTPHPRSDSLSSISLNDNSLLFFHTQCGPPCSRSGTPLPSLGPGPRAAASERRRPRLHSELPLSLDPSYGLRLRLSRCSWASESRTLLPAPLEIDPSNIYIKSCSADLNQTFLSHSHQPHQHSSNSQLQHSSPQQLVFYDYFFDTPNQLPKWPPRSLPFSGRKSSRRLVVVCLPSSPMPIHCLPIGINALHPHASTPDNSHPHGSRNLPLRPSCTTPHKTPPFAP